MRIRSLIPFTACLLWGCVATAVQPGQDLEPFVGKSVTVEGKVERASVFLSGADSAGWCLTLPPGNVPSPKTESTLRSGDAGVLFVMDEAKDSPKVGTRARVTGRLTRAIRSESTTQPAVTYQLAGASWKPAE